MLLVVDVGNTQTHFGTFRGDELVEHWRFATVRDSTADELGAALRNLLELRGVGFDDLAASIISSTVPQLEPEWMLDGRALPRPRHARRRPGAEDRDGDPHRQPARARRRPARQRRRRARAPRRALHLASTSAPPSTTTSSRPTGEYLGGVIAPGVEISLDALTSRGAKLPRIDLARAARARSARAPSRRSARGSCSASPAQVDGDRHAHPRGARRAGADDRDGRPRRAHRALHETIDHVDDLLTLTGLRLLTSATR